MHILLWKYKASVYKVSNTLYTVNYNQNGHINFLSETNQLNVQKLLLYVIINDFRAI